jgi:hypothetical protein
MTQLYKPRFAATTQQDKLISGIGIRWQALTLAERVVCASIVLIPLWWVLGIYRYFTTLLLLGVVAYDWQKYGEIRLKRPSIPVIALISFGAYQVAKIITAYSVSGRDTFTTVFLLTFCPAIWLWYVQSNHIKIRLDVVIWACTVSAVQMVVFWVLLQFVIPETIFIPARIQNVYAFLTGQGVMEGFINNPNFLQPYANYGNSIGDRRYNLFFIYPEFFAVFAGFIGLVALEIKNRFWFFLLLAASVLLIIISGTRAVWVAFPILVMLYYMLQNLTKLWGPPIICALIALISFTTLSLPPVTSTITNTFSQTSQSVSEARENSTEVRNAIYRQTWQDLLGNEDALIWGFPSSGKAIAVTGSNSNAVVGSHSFILGSLLYRNGIIGTTIFAVFWVSLFIEFYQTRAARPLFCFCVLIFYTLLAPTTPVVYEMHVSGLLIVLCVALRSPKSKLQGVRKPCRSF